MARDSLGHFVLRSIKEMLRCLRTQQAYSLTYRYPRSTLQTLQAHSLLSSAEQFRTSGRVLSFQPGTSWRCSSQKTTNGCCLFVLVREPEVEPPNILFEDEKVDLRNSEVQNISKRTKRSSHKSRRKRTRTVKTGSTDASLFLVARLSFFRNQTVLFSETKSIQ